MSEGWFGGGCLASGLAVGLHLRLALKRKPVKLVACLALAALATLGLGARCARAATYTESVLYSFCSLGDCTDGSDPVGGVIQGSDGNFYGTTDGGGANGNYGTVFKVTPSGTLTTLYSFCSQGGTSCTDGRLPWSGLIQGRDGNFYGTTNIAGAHFFGTVYKLTPSGALTTIHSFCSVVSVVGDVAACLDGAFPFAGVIQGSDGNFYGTTAAGGANASANSGNGGGTVFKLTSSGRLTTLYSFCSQAGCADGYYPFAGVIQGSDGNFYGSTGFGGANPYGVTDGPGTVFKLTPSGTLTTLYSFCSQANCPDGYAPGAGVIQGSDGNFYGTTESGGANPYGVTDGPGTVFKLTPSGTLTTLYSFCSQGNCADGEYPDAGLIQGSDGNFYGTTDGGGANGNYGTVFKLTPSGTLTILYSFCSQANCTDGKYLVAGLIQGKDGNFYGTTDDGGANIDGTVFELLPPTPTATATATATPTATATLTATPTATQTATATATATSTATATASATATQTATQTATATSTATATTTATATATATATPTATPTTSISVPASLAFGNEPVGDTVTRNLTVRNTGTKPLLVTSVSSNNSQFAVTSNNCPASGIGLAHNSTCTIAIGFTPNALHGQSATLQVFDNVATSPQSVALSGAGTIDMTVRPSSDAFGSVKDGKKSSRLVVVYNYQTNPVSLSESFSGSNPGDFSITGGTCSSTLGAKSDCSLFVTFAPTVVGTESATMTVTDGPDTLGPYTVSLSGTGVTPLEVTPASLAFGTVKGGKTSAAKTVVVVNLGGATISLSESISGPSDFAVTGGTCSGTLAGGTSCTYLLKFTPSIVGAESATLGVSAVGDAASPHIVSLSGTGS